VVDWATNRLNLSRSRKLNDKNNTKKIRKMIALWSAALAIRTSVPIRESGESWVPYRYSRELHVTDVQKRHVTVHNTKFN